MTYLNTGSAGPLLAAAAAAMHEQLDTELSEGRADAASWLRFSDDRAALRTELAELVNASADEIVLTPHTTEGLNIALWGHDWAPGDRVLVTSVEHDAALAALAALAARHQLVVDVVEVGDGGREDVVAALTDALRTPARLLLTSHVAWSTGAVLPVAEMAVLAHAAGAVVVVDGAQAVGAIDVDVAALDADCYAFNGYKWLCGPEGTGVLVVARRWHDRLRVSSGGAFGVQPASVDVHHLDAMQPAPGAARYESGSSSRPNVAGLAAAVRWHRSQDDVAARIADVVSYCATGLSALGATIHTPATQRSGLLCFTLPDAGIDAATVVGALAERAVVIRAVPTTSYLRVSCAVFTTTDDVDRLVDAIREITRPSSSA